ncbi:MAG: AMP-binding protein [Byssovorax sp.]
MSFRDKIKTLTEEGRQALFRVETIGRVGMKLGMPQAMTLPGVKVLAREVARGKLNPSLLFRLHAENVPERTALIQATSPGHRDHEGVRRIYSYRETNETIDRIAQGLHRRGLGRGTAALLLLKNRIELLMIQPAQGRIGGTVVPASWRSTVPEIEYLAHHARARAIFFDADIAEVIREALPRLESIPQGNFISVGGKAEGFTSFEELVAEGGGEAPDHSEDSAVVMYTSGTTGKPKGARRSIQKEAFAAAMAFLGETPLTLGGVHLAACPLYHATAFGFTGFAFLLGGTIAVMADFKPEPFLELVERHHVESTALVPTMIHRLVELGPSVVRKYDTSSLKAIFSGGAPLSGPLAIEAMNLLGDKIYNFYGATETGIVTLAKPEDLRASPGTIGRAVPGNEIHIVDDQGRECGVDQVGELYAKNGMMVDGYDKDPDATKSARMPSGCFSVGDLARRDARGCYHIEGRKRDMIISGGVNVYPAEVEGVLHEHPAVSEAAVVGVPDREWGERVRAFVVLRAGADASDDDLKAHCRARLAGPKVPRDYVFLAALPKNPTGKVLKRELRMMEGAGS